MMRIAFSRPYRLFLLAAALAFLMCLFPASPGKETDGAPPAAAAADLSERTQAGCMLRETLYYAPCAHSVTRREALNARLVGLSLAALEKEIASVYPGAVITEFSAGEVTVSRSLSLPCPLHWVLRAGEDGFLHVLQNKTGEALSPVRATEVPLNRIGEGERQTLIDGRIFDDVQSLEGFLESAGS